MCVCECKLDNGRPNETFGQPTCNQFIYTICIICLCYNVNIIMTGTVSVGLLAPPFI